MLKAIREQSVKDPGDIIEVVVWKDEEVRTVEVSAQFENLMKKEGLLPVLKKLSSLRPSQGVLSLDYRSEKARNTKKGLEKAIEMLTEGSKDPWVEHHELNYERLQLAPLGFWPGLRAALT